MSPADLEKIVEMALREGIRSDCVVTDEMLDEALEKSVHGEGWAENPEEEIRNTAYHEAGHAIVYLYYGKVPSYMSVVARSDFYGYVKTERDERQPTKEMMLRKICACLGGRAAEMEMGYGLTPGASSDLEHATSIAKHMVCRLGMYEEEIGLSVLSDEEYCNDTEARKLVNRILSEQLREARRIVTEKRDVVERLTEAVLRNKKQYLTKKEIEAIYKGEDHGCE
jgi:ATP-dependent Zn protease